MPDGTREYESAYFRPSAATLYYPHLTIAADVDLHNRDELLEALGISGSQAASMGDRDLLLAAYAKWEEKCVDFLLGEFAFAIWDDRLKRLFCCRDHCGFRAFLYYHEQGRFVFASDIEPILACPGVPRKLNRRKLAALNVPAGHQRFHRETFHEGILSLPAAAWMTVERDRIRRQSYWVPDLKAHFIPRRPEEAFEALREVLFRAVECRISDDYPVAAMLSGGLDSSTVTAIAARCLEKRNRQMTALAAVLPKDGPPQLADERNYIDEFRAWPNVHIEYVTAPGRGPFDFLDTPHRFYASPMLSSTVYLYQECDRIARSLGARVVLGGEGGELGVSAWSERYYIELAFGFRWFTLGRELVKLRSVRSVSPIRFFGGELLRVLSPPRRREPYALLTPEFLREFQTRRRWSINSPNQRRHHAELLRLWLGKHANGRGQTAFDLLPHSFPLLDKRVLEFCLSLPASLNVQDGYQRYMVRKAMEGVLPKRIQWRTGKTPFSPDYFVRFNSQLGMARDFVASIGKSDPVRSVVDVGLLARLLHPVDPLTGSQDARSRIPITIYTINFLRQFAEFQR